MDDYLELLGDNIRKSEYNDLFPDKEVEEVKNDEELLKEAVFQVHHVLWNEELYERVHDDDEDYYISIPELKELSDDEEQFNRIQRMLRGATVTTNDEGHTLVPKTDLKDVLAARRGLMD